MTHQEIEQNEIVERYVLHQLGPDERRAFQDHYFDCDECFAQTEVAARFIASVHQASRTGAFSAENRASGLADQVPAGVVGHAWARPWAVPALAALLVLAVGLTALWALSLSRENRQLAARTAEQRITSEVLNARVQELETDSKALKEQAESAKAENTRLKEKLAEAEQERESQLAQLGQFDVNIPIRNVYPVDDPLRSGSAGEANRVHIPRGTRTFVLILSDYKPGYSSYRLEIKDPSGRVVARREGLIPDHSGELSVMLNRTQFTGNKYLLKLYGQQRQIAEYVILVD
ncbi:MAG TPA: hypothetical protein VFV34_06850 [Blastocatellia bacterium]|nr:hypothetical protein [Blastocatellia bacterium]